MIIKDLREHFLKWEDDNKFYDFKVNNISIYTFIRFELFEALVLEINPIVSFQKNEDQLKHKIDYFGILRNSLFFFVKIFKLFKKEIVITNSENRIKVKNIYQDIFFEKIIENINKDFAVLEFPNVKTLHKKPRSYETNTVNADFFYLLEKIITLNNKKDNIKNFTRHITLSYNKLYYKIHKTNIDCDILQKKIENRVYRNIKRKSIYFHFFRLTKPKKIYIKSAYTPLNQIIISNAITNNIPVIEVQHGHIYPSHIGYLLPFNKKHHDLFPNYIYLWSNYYKEVLLNNNWPNNKLLNIGNFTLKKFSKATQIDSELINIKNEYETIITILSQHTLADKFIDYLSDIKKLPENVGIIIKLHPKYTDFQIEKYSTISTKNNIHILNQVDIYELFSISDLLVSAYSTSIIEAIQVRKKVHLLKTQSSSLYENLLNMRQLVFSSSIYESYENMNNYDIMSMSLIQDFNPELLIK